MVLGAPTMEYSSFDCAGVRAAAQTSRFRGASGVDEVHVVARPTEPGSFQDQLDQVSHAYRRALDQLEVDPSSAILRRLYCSDLANQASALEAHELTSRDAPDGHCAVSWVGQPPVPSAKVALSAYHVRDPHGLCVTRCNGSVSLERGELTHHWTTGISSRNGSTTYEQTRGVFSRYDGFLRARGLALANHVLRTWIFVQDIDANYRDMVAARREHFADHGLTPDTHFIASSGIEGRWADPSSRVVMDAYAIGGVRPEQIRYLAAPDHLGPTHTYGVTFERATAIDYLDRRHVILSGTASIDPDGRIVHPGDVVRQLDRTLENMAALLRQAGATLADIGVFTVYVRDQGDYAVAGRRMRERFCDAPIQVVAAPVCRPGWLIEVEGTAVIQASNPDLPPF
jgi:enamine deaminase RidA (YjgF/YER057c/UK114 family)